MSADNSDCSKKRVLSAEKRGEFEGKLIVLSEGAKETSRDKFHDRYMLSLSSISNFCMVIYDSSAFNSMSVLFTDRFMQRLFAMQQSF